MLNKGHDITPNYTCVEEERIVARGLIWQMFLDQIANKLTQTKIRNSFREANNSSDTQEAAPHLCKRKFTLSLLHPVMIDVKSVHPLRFTTLLHEQI
jgi:hypothetical protein